MGHHRGGLLEWPEWIIIRKKRKFCLRGFTFPKLRQHRLWATCRSCGQVLGRLVSLSSLVAGSITPLAEEVHAWLFCGGLFLQSARWLQLWQRDKLSYALVHFITLPGESQPKVLKLCAQNCGSVMLYGRDDLAAGVSLFQWPLMACRCGFSVGTVVGCWCERSGLYPTASVAFRSRRNVRGPCTVWRLRTLENPR